MRAVLRVFGIRVGSIEFVDDSPMDEEERPEPEPTYRAPLGFVHQGE